MNLSNLGGKAHRKKRLQKLSKKTQLNQHFSHWGQVVKTQLGGRSKSARTGYVFELEGSTLVNGRIAFILRRQGKSCYGTDDEFEAMQGKRILLSGRVHENLLFVDPDHFVH